MRVTSPRGHQFIRLSLLGCRRQWMSCDYPLFLFGGRRKSPARSLNPYFFLFKLKYMKDKHKNTIDCFFSDLRGVRDNKKCYKTCITLLVDSKRFLIGYFNTRYSISNIPFFVFRIYISVRVFR